MTSQPYTLEDESAVVQRMINYYQTAQTQITDFNEGSEVRNLLESVGQTNYELRQLADYILNMGYVQNATGAWLDAIGLLFGVLRKPAVQSTGPLVISVPDVLLYDVDVPDGTLLTCSSDNTLYFQTVGDQTFTAGLLTLNLTGIAQLGGVDGNIAPNIINGFYTQIDSLQITNPTAFENGLDVEDDTSLRSRILDAGQGNITGSVMWYKAQAESIEGVHDVMVINNPPIPGYDIELLVNGNIQPTSSDILTAVTDLFSQDDHAIAGVNVYVVAPTFITENIAIAIKLKPGYDWDTIIETLEADLTAYFKGGTTSYGVDFPGLNGGDSLTLSMLQMVTANSLQLSFIDFNITTPTEDIIITDTQAIVLGTTTFTPVS